MLTALSSSAAISAAHRSYSAAFLQSRADHSLFNRPLTPGATLSVWQKMKSSKQVAEMLHYTLAVIEDLHKTTVHTPGETCAIEALKSVLRGGPYGALTIALDCRLGTTPMTS